jgi:hypothetical protein
MMVVEVGGARMGQGEEAGRPGHDLRRVQVLALVAEELSGHELVEAKHKQQKDWIHDGQASSVADCAKDVLSCLVCLRREPKVMERLP